MAGTKDGAEERLETLRHQSRETRADFQGEYLEVWNDSFGSE